MIVYKDNSNHRKSEEDRKKREVPTKIFLSLIQSWVKNVMMDCSDRMF